MPANILNLLVYNVTSLQENDHDYHIDADVVGAINIKAAGLAVLACGEAAQSGASMKQEPSDETMHAFA